MKTVDCPLTVQELTQVVGRPLREVDRPLVMVGPFVVLNLVLAHPLVGRVLNPMVVDRPFVDQVYGEGPPIRGPGLEPDGGGPPICGPGLEPDGGGPPIEPDGA
eukprot:1149159_1